MQEKTFTSEKGFCQIFVTKKLDLAKNCSKNAFSRIVLDIFSSFKNYARYVYFENQYKVYKLVSWCTISYKLHSSMAMCSFSQFSLATAGLTVSIYTRYVECDPHIKFLTVELKNMLTAMRVQ